MQTQIKPENQTMEPTTIDVSIILPLLYMPHVVLLLLLLFLLLTLLCYRALYIYMYIYIYILRALYTLWYNTVVDLDCILYLSIV